MKPKVQAARKDRTLHATKRVLVLALFAIIPVVDAKDVFSLVLQDHVFTPNEIVIPANKKVRIVIDNRDKTAEEFDSFDLNRERVLFGKRQTTIFVGPLPPGRYEYFGEYHPNSARGVVLVEEGE